MKTLVPFVAVCLGLLALLAWELRSATRDAPTDPAAPLKEHPLQPLATGPGLSVESSQATGQSKSADAALHAELEGVAPPPATAATTQTVAGRLQAASAPTTQSAVHWATDVRRRRAKERFSRIRETLAAEPHSEAALQAALGLARELEWHNEACDLLARLVRLRPEDTALRFELATELMRLERWLEAIPQLRAVVRRQPENARAWYDLAIAHQALGHLHDARATWDRVVTFMPENPDVYAHRGEVLLDLHAWPAAAADFETALRLEPESIDAAMNLSLALSKLGRLADARETLLPVLEQHPQHVPVLNRLAQIAWELYGRDPVTNATLSDETASFCLRSLAVDADQPEIKALLERASPAGN